jgi:hypothetical protein
MYGSESVDPTRSGEFQRHVNTELNRAIEGLTGGVRGCVATLMIAVNSDIKTQILSQILIVAITKHCRIIS